MNFHLPISEFDKVYNSELFHDGYVELHITKREPHSFMNRNVACASINFGTFRSHKVISKETWEEVECIIKEKVVPNENIRRTISKRRS